MSKGWADLFREHQVHETLRTIRTVAAGAEDAFKEDPAALEVHRTMSAGLKYTQKVIDETVPELASQTVLDQLNSSLSQLVNHVQEYKNQANESQLSQIQERIREILNRLAPLPLANTTLSGDVFKSVTESFERATQQAMEKVRKGEEDLRKALSSTQVEATGAQNELKKLQARIDEMDTHLQKRADELSEEYGRVSEEQIQRLNKETEKRTEQFATQAKEIIEQLEADKNKSRELLSIVGEEALTTDFSKSAIQESDAANRYRWASIGAMAIAVGMLSWLVYDLSKLGFQWEMAVVRTLIAAVLFVPATYLAKESSNHRLRGAFYKRMALELSALGPFIQDLDNETRNQKITELTDRYFGQATEVAPTQDGISLELLERVLKMFKKS